MAVDHAIGDVRFQIRHSAYRHRNLHALVGCRHPKRRRPAAADAGHREALRINIWPADEIIDPAHAVPRLDTRRRISPRMPPPAAQVERAVVKRRDLAKLQRIDD